MLGEVSLSVCSRSSLFSDLDLCTLLKLHLHVWIMGHFKLLVVISQKRQQNIQQAQFLYWLTSTSQHEEELEGRRLGLSVSILAWKAHFSACPPSRKSFPSLDFAPWALVTLYPIFQKNDVFFAVLFPLNPFWPVIRHAAIHIVPSLINKIMTAFYDRLLCAEL